MRIYKLTILIFLATGCKFNNTKTGRHGQVEKTKKLGIELDSRLIEDFYQRDDLDNFIKVKEFKIDLDKNGIEDLIILNKLRDIGDDPGDFHQIIIQLDNGNKWSQINVGGWVRFDNNYSIPDPIKNLNQINTDLILLTNFGDTKIIGLFGWVYASEPGLLTIVEFSSGLPRIMINKQFDLVSMDSNRITTKFLDDKCWTELYNNKLIMTCE